MRRKLVRHAATVSATAAALIISTLLTLGGCSQGKETPTFRVGYMICNSIEETRARFEPLSAYLSEATGARFEPVFIDTVDIEEHFEKGELDFTHTNSLLYVLLAERHGAKLVVADKRGAFGALTRGTIIVRADSPIKTLSDLADKRLVFGPQWAPFGFLSQYALLLDGGVDPEVDLGPYSFPGGSWKHEKIVYSVLYGAYDAGAAPLIDLEEMTAEAKIAPGAFRILASSELAPYCTVAASGKVEKIWSSKVREALLALTPETTVEIGGERLKVLDRALLTGFAALDDSAYDTIRAWAKTARMPPYDDE
jgi:phosphonate transport system substrate-binding protein